MTREEVKALLDQLNITSSMSDYDVRDRLDELGYKRPDVKVCDGATKICLIFRNTDFIVKWSYNCDDDESESVKECRIYACAVEAGLANFFPKTEIMGKWGDVTVIIQDRIDYSASDIDYDHRVKFNQIAHTVTNRIFEKMEEGFKCYCGYDRDLDKTWGRLVIALYGKRVTKRLCSFIREHKINDLHGANIGYKDNKPIILDFSGYYR